MADDNPNTGRDSGTAEGRFIELGATVSGADTPASGVLGQQDLAREVAVAFCYNGITHGVMMASPQDLEDFAFGFSLTAGVIQHRDQIVDLEAEVASDSAMLHITLSQRALHQLRSARRVMAGTSGCGLCGVDALAQALAPPDSSSFPDFAAVPPVMHFSELRTRFQLAQQYRKSSGAMHAAMFVDARGTTRLCREDIGRHNALDKLIGACLREGLSLRAGFAAITSRCSLELIQKSLRAGIGTLVSLASPSDIAVRWARQYRLNLLHQPTRGPARLFSGAPVEQLTPKKFPAE